MSAKDSVVPFVFDSIPLRGALLQLEATWQRMQRDHNYAEPVAAVLGDAVAATALIAQSLKLTGSVTLQINAEGPLGMLVVQCTDNLDIRGMATAGEVAGTETFAGLTAASRCAVTVDAGAMDRPYQGIVEMHPDSLAASLERYFARSVQVPSHLALVNNAAVHGAETGRSAHKLAPFCGGLLVQQMPGEKSIRDDDWQRIGLLMATLRAGDFVAGATPDLVRRLFPEDDVRVFRAREVRFRCRCSQAKVEDVLRLLGKSETSAALEEKGHIDVTCEYCGETRRFDPQDVRRVFSGQLLQGSASVH